jgi:hypothetical protein
VSLINDGSRYICIHTEKSLKIVDTLNEYRVRWEFPKEAAVDKIIHAHAMVSVGGEKERLRIITVSAHNYVEVWDFLETA